MSSEDTDIDLTDPSRGGVFFVVEEDLEALAASGAEHGLFVARTSLEDCRDKADLLRRLAASLRLPADFGHNWDALADALRDFAWLGRHGGYLLLFDRADGMRQAHEEDFDTMLDILDEAAENWFDTGVPFFAFFALPESAFDEADL